MSHYPEVFAVETGCLPLVAHVRGRLVHRFVSELERPPVGRGYDEWSTALGRSQLSDRLHTVFGIHVNGTHEPTRLVRPDRQNCEINGAASRRNRAEFGMKAGVPREEQRPLGRAKNPTAPQGVVALAKRPAREVLGRDARQAEATKQSLFPPVSFDHLTSPALAEEVADSQW